MGKLGDIIRGKVKKEEVIESLTINERLAPSPVQVEMDDKAKASPTTAYYNRTWLSRVALQRGYAINPDEKRVDGILAALNRKGGFCPCGGTGSQFKCPCKIMRENGICKCGLYLNIPDRVIGGSSSGGHIDR